MSTTRGQNLIGKEIGYCVLEELLGYGGSSAVFLAHRTSSQEKVAVKVFLPRPNMDRQTQRAFYKRFLLEAEAASELDHPNIVSIYSYGEQNGLPYIVMSYIPGGTLSDYVNNHGPLSFDEAQWYLEDLSCALDYAHEHGCVHCDVKPANILLDGQGHVLLSDFGIARLMQPDAPAVQRDAQSQESQEPLMGTLAYISPEQALGKRLDGRSDIYSLAVTLYFLLTGRPPFFKAQSDIGLALMHVHEPPPSLSLRRPDITPEIDRVVQKALAKTPEDRYQTASEFCAAFAQAVAESAGSEPIATQPTQRRLGIPLFAKNGANHSLPPSHPLIAVRPVQQPSLRFSRIAIAIFLLVLILTASAITTAIITIHINRTQIPIASPTKTKTLLDHLAQDENAWTPVTAGTNVSFTTDGHYHIRNTSPRNLALSLYGEYLPAYKYTDFQLTVTISEIHGFQDVTDNYGVAFRSATNGSDFYVFAVGAYYGGQYEFIRYDEGKQNMSHTHSGALPSPLHTIKQNNVITVVAIGNTFSFFVNGKPITFFVNDKYVDKITDTPALASGWIGLYVEEKNAEVAFSNLLITPLP